MALSNQHNPAAVVRCRQYRPVFLAGSQRRRIHACPRRFVPSGSSTYHRARLRGLGRVPRIHARLRHLATKPGKESGLTTHFPNRTIYWSVPVGSLQERLPDRG